MIRLHFGIVVTIWSGLLTFEKSITVLYDMFGFRRDEFDRLNNEDIYPDSNCIIVAEKPV
ncbi:MAG: hypothetical protein K6C35_06185 [Eubacterium sp.]|nr:hypothetical protein [Eubacterium sp.]